MSNDVTIIDYGLGNIRSVQNMIKKIGCNSIISSDTNVILNSKKLILPGVGSFGKGMNNLKSKGLINTLNEKVLNDQTPILGICLGMQLMTKFSEESNLEGLDWIDAKTIKFQKSNMSDEYKIPHMGWSEIDIKKRSNCFVNVDKEQRFYFTHAYHVKCQDDSNVLATTKYGYNFTSAFIKDNIVGVQFHPEKSHVFGMQFFKNFILEF